MSLFNKAKTNKIKTPKKDTFTEWLESKYKNLPEDAFLYLPELDPQKAVYILCDYLLGTDWCVAGSANGRQVNTSIVHSILWEYSEEYRKEYKKYIKSKNVVK